MPTYPSPKPTLIFTSYLEQNVGFGEGKVGGQFPRVCFMAPRSPLLTSIPLLNTNSTLLLIIVDMQKKKKIKK